MGDALPLPDNPSDSVNEGRLTQTLEEKDFEKSDERKDSVESEEWRC